MRYTKSGNSDLSVSRFCLGCMGFGEAGNGQHSRTVDADRSREIIKRALELAYPEEPYVPRALVGVMAQNTAAAKKSPVWSTGNQEIKRQNKEELL